MKDELSDLYIESVRNPKNKTTAKASNNDKGRAGNMEAGQDFGFSEAGTQKGTGPEAVKGLQKPKNAKKPLTEDAEAVEDMDTNTETQTPEIGSKFDELFSQTISEEFGAEEATHDMGPSDSDLGDGSSDFPSDEGDPGDTGEEVSLKSELKVIIDRLTEIFNNIEGDEDENGEGEGDENGFGSPEEGGDIESLETANNHMAQRPFGEASANAQGKGDAGMDKKRDGAMHKAKDFDKGFQKPTGSNTVSGYYGKKTMKGQPGESGMSKPRDGVLRKAPDFDKSLQKPTGSNKVNTTSVMSKPGANLFD